MRWNTLVICLVYLVRLIYSHDIFVSCNGRCHKGISESKCTTHGIENQTRILGIPPRKPRIHSAHWYVYEADEKRVAINVTWVDTGYSVLHDESEGYTLEIMQERSTVIFGMLFKLNFKSIGQHNIMQPTETQVYINYKCYGLSETITPGMAYFIVLKSLPLPQPDPEVDTEYESAVVIIPECTNDDLSQTFNCKNKDISDFSTTSAIVTFKSTKPHIVLETGAPLLLAVFCISVIVVVLFFVYFLKRKTNQHDMPVSSKKLFLVISSAITHFEPWYAKAGDELAQYFSSLGMEVVYSLWKTTEIDMSNPIDWVKRYVSEAHHVIIICTPSCLSDTCNSSTCKGCYQKTKSTIFDPCAVVLNMMRYDLTQIDKYCVITFKKFSNETFDVLPRSVIYQLPEDEYNFFLKIIGIENFPTNVKFISLLKYLIEKIRANALYAPDHNRCEANNAESARLLSNKCALATDQGVNNAAVKE